MFNMHILYYISLFPLWLFVIHHFTHTAHLVSCNIVLNQVCSDTTNYS